MVEERSGLNWVALGYEPLDGAFRDLASADADVRAEASRLLFEAGVQEDKRYLVRSYVVVRYIQLLSNPNADKYDVLTTLTQLSYPDPELSEQDNHRIQSLLANNDAAFTLFLNEETLRDYALEMIGNLYHYADRFTPLLFRSFSHDDPSVVYTLARLITKEVSHAEIYIEFFESNLVSPNAGIRASSAFAVAKLLGENSPPLVETILLQSQLYSDLNKFLEPLTYLGVDRAEKALLRKLADETDRDRLFKIVMHLLIWRFERYPDSMHYVQVPSFFRPKNRQDKSTLVILGLLLRGWLLDKFPSLRHRFFQTANARAKYIYFVDDSHSLNELIGVPRREAFAEAQKVLMKHLLGVSQIWQYETNIFELFGMPNSKRELKRLFG